MQPIRCIFSPLISGVGGILLGISGQILQLSGYLFDVLLSHVVVAFGQTMRTFGLIDGIHTGWTVLRDLSNIVIIGMFTFIAISIIIGNHTFGEKKLVAKVLIVAVLINFSLLFAKIVIDSSNFIAYQIYKSMTPQGSGDGSIRGLAAGTGANISGRYLSIVGATGLFDAISTVNSKSENAISDGIRAGNDGVLNSLAGAAKGVFYALIGSVFLLFAAGVFFYGSYLIAARAVLLVFLMLVSAFAFATYLIPKYADGEYGWSSWWKSLINASIFGPLLMVLLYVSLVILTPIADLQQASARERSTLGTIIGDPSSIAKNNNDWQILFLFIFGIGMLYASFKVANSFAGKIAGMPSSIPSLVNPLAPLVGSSRLLGLMGRSSVGRLADRRHSALLKEQSDLEAKNKKMGWGGMLATRMYGNLKQRTFDPANTKPASKLLSMAGGPDLLKDAGKGGYSGVQKRKTDHAVHVAAENTEKTSAAADRYEKEKRQELKKKIVSELEKTREEIKKGRVQQKEISAEDKKVLANETQRTRQEGGQGAGTAAGAGAGVADQIRREADAQHSRSAERQRVQGEMASKIGKAQEEAIERATELTGGSQKVLEDREKALLAELHDIEHSDIKDISNKKHADEIKDARGHGEHAAHAAELNFANSVGALNLGRLLGDNKVLDSIPGAISGHAKKAKIRETLTELQALQAENAGDAHGGAHATPAPHAAAATGHAAPVAAKGGDHGHAPPHK